LREVGCGGARGVEFVGGGGAIGLARVRRVEGGVVAWRGSEQKSSHASWIGGVGVIWPAERALRHEPPVNQRVEGDLSHFRCAGVCRRVRRAEWDRSVRRAGPPDTMTGP
jgi:hypothetical protein